MLRGVTIRSYYVTEYNNLKEELMWLKDREITLQERLESITADCFEIWMSPLKSLLPLDYVKSRL